MSNMRKRFVLSLLSACGWYLILGGDAALLGQQDRNAKEITRPKEQPLKLDKELGVPALRIGQGRLRQVDVTLVEIPQGGKLPPHRHLAEEMIYIVSGKGYTQMWAESEAKKARYDWAEGDLVSPSLNAWHQHFNASADQPARYVSITTSPLTENVFGNRTFASSSTFVFEDRWKKAAAQKPEFVGDRRSQGPENVRMLAGHLLPNLRNREMQDRGQNMLGITINPEGDMAGNSLLEMEVREFTTANATSPQHRHLWETFYYILKGNGYSSLQKEGGPERKFDWNEGDLFVVEANEYHNHRPRGSPGGRFLQIKASGYFRRVGLADDFLMQNRPNK